jgi:carboxypeptidase family protein
MNTQSRLVLRLLLCVPLLLFPFGSLRSQDKSSANPDGMTYEHHNQIDPQPLSVRSVVGNVQDEQGVPIQNAVLGLFTENEHKLITSAQVSHDGTFKLPDVPPGRYRLVVKYDSFCAANIPIEISRQVWGTRPIYVYMKPGGIDSCSYGQIGQKRKQ